VRKKLLIGLTFIGGLYYFLLWVLPRESPLENTYVEFGKVTLVIGAFAFLLGVINLTRMHGGKILRRRPGYHNSIGLLAAMLAMGFAQLMVYYLKPTPDWITKMHTLLFFHMRIPIDSTIFSLLAFYMASAAYRAFRIKSVEAGLMMVVAVIVMLGEISVGNYLTSGLPYSFRVEIVSEWLKKYWNGAAERGILFGAMVGALALSMRIWLSLERGSFFDREV
jgi:hypothetical protein